MAGLSIANLALRSCTTCRTELVTENDNAVQINQLNGIFYARDGETARRLALLRLCHKDFNPAIACAVGFAGIGNQRLVRTTTIDMEASRRHPA